jgi:hypothetical protein
MKFSHTKSIIISILAAVCISITCGDLGWQQEYEQARRDYIEDITGIINDLNNFKQQFPTIAQAEQTFLTQVIDSFIAHAPQTTKDEVMALYRIFGEISLKKALQRLYKSKHFWENHPYDPLHAELLINLLDRFEAITNQIAAQENELREDIENMPNEQIVPRFIRFFPASKLLHQRLDDLFNEMAPMD